MSLLASRSIPAHAGEPSARTSGARTFPEYRGLSPRTRGSQDPPRSIWGPREVYPRARGGAEIGRAQGFGSIPAHAGEPLVCKWLQRCWLRGIGQNFRYSYASGKKDSVGVHDLFRRLAQDFDLEMPAVVSRQIKMRAPPTNSTTRAASLAIT